MQQENHNSTEGLKCKYIHKESEKENNNINWFLLILLLILIGVGIMIYIKIGKELQARKDQGGVILQIDTSASEYIPTEAEKENMQGVAIPGWGTLSIPANQQEVPVNFFNPEANEGKYYLTFELRLPNDNEQDYEILYTSGLNEPGLYIQNATLSRELEEGNYEATIHVQPYYMDELKTPTNNADLKTKLVVE